MAVVITFGLVSISCKHGKAASSKAVGFTRVTKEGHHRVKGRTFDVETDKEVANDELMKAFELKKGKNALAVPLTDEDLESLGASGDNGHIEVKEFVTAQLRPYEVEQTYFLTPDPSSEKGYALLAMAMKNRGCVAVGQWTAGGKENIVILTPYTEGPNIGLLLQPIFYQNEMRDFRAASVDASKANVSALESKMADKLLDMLFTGAFDTSKYSDNYGERVRALAEKKAEGKVIAPLTEKVPQASNVVDLMALLEKSIAAHEKAPSP